MRWIWSKQKETLAPTATNGSTTHAPSFGRGLTTRIKGVTDFIRFSLVRIFVFILLIFTYVVARLSFRIWYWRVIWQEHHGGSGQAMGTPSEILFSRYTSRLFRLLRTATPGSIDKVSLIEIAIRNMKAKKTRTAVTIGGMAIGIGSIVFLVSLGYGVQRLVISQVARLEEMQQADVSLQPGGRIKIQDATLNDFRAIPNVSDALPLISVVGRVNYQNSVSDMAVYGVTTQYLSQSAIRPVQGKFYQSEDLLVRETKENTSFGEEMNTVKQRGVVIEQIAFSSSGLNWVRLRDGPDPEAPLLGFGRIENTEQRGDLVWGENYASADGFGEVELDDAGRPLKRWIRGNFPLFEETDCDPSSADCIGGKYQLQRDENEVIQTRPAYFALTDDWLTLRSLTESEKTQTADPSGSTASLSILDSGDGWVEIAGEGEDAAQENVRRVPLVSQAVRQAVVSRAMLRILGLNEAEAVAKTFNVSFVVTGSLLTDSQEKVESIPEDYTIVGVIPEDQSPIFYVPFIDLRGLGIEFYSEAKITARSQELLADVRKQVEGMGYVTNSVADTVSQINSFFSSARIILGLLGMVALGVAALGMFNTLTVSLLERTREVGLMKAIGMRSIEVQELFLTESMVMAFFGGILGLLVGVVGGKLLGAGLSVLAIFKGAGAIDVSYIPASFVIAILIFSLFVGIVTGLYPARRATKISALNALRYE